ncbi:MAG TPA: 50S ribosomal protein L21 [Candidatus Avanaerovorax faecigallinarum]|jgi:large subunit ribosomal protein L21|nr:50S ribosomal protein L21 [Candidatus Avanaerovorax faecigallinarum]
MYAIIETGGKQYRVQEGDVITVEKLDVNAGDKVELDKVLVLSDDNGLKVGTPYVEGAKVIAEAVENGKGKKVIIFKYKAKKDYRKKQGHRQPYTMIEIKSLGGKATAKAAPKKEEAKEEPKAEVKAEKKVSASMKKDELIAYAKEHGIEIDEKATKAVIIETIEAANK